MPPLLGRYSLWEGPCEEIQTLSDSYLLSVVPLLCQVWGFTLSTLLLPHGSLQCQRVIAVLRDQFIMHVVRFLCCVSQLVRPSFLSSGFLWRPSEELPAGQLYNGNALVPGKCYVAWLQRLRILHSNQYSKQFSLNIGEIVLPYTGNMFKHCGTSRRCSDPCYVERAD